MGVSNCAAGAKKIGVFADLRVVFGDFQPILAPILVLNPPYLRVDFWTRGGFKTRIYTDCVSESPKVSD